MLRVMPNDTHELIPTTAAAAILGCSVFAVHRLIKAGHLAPAMKGAGLRGAAWFQRADVEALAAARAASKRAS